MLHGTSVPTLGMYKQIEVSVSYVTSSSHNSTTHILTVALVCMVMPHTPPSLALNSESFQLPSSQEVMWVLLPWWLRWINPRVYTDVWSFDMKNRVRHPPSPAEFFTLKRNISGYSQCLPKQDDIAQYYLAVVVSRKTSLPLYRYFSSAPQLVCPSTQGLAFQHTRGCKRKQKRN